MMSTRRSRASPGDRIARLARDFLADGVATAGARDTPLAERVHTGRTACKKARAMLRLARTADADFCERENARLRQAAQRLARLREAEALVDTAESLQGRDRDDRAALRGLQRAVTAHRAAVLHDQGAIEHRLAEFRRQLETVRHHLGRWHPRTRALNDVLDGARKRYRQARRLGRKLRPGDSGPAYHEWRKAAKTLGDEFRLLEPLDRKRIGRFRKKIGRLNHVLGHEHDLTLLKDFVARRAAAAEPLSDPRRLKKIICERRRKLRRRAHRRARRLFAAKPRRFIRRFGGGR